MNVYPSDFSHLIIYNENGVLYAGQQGKVYRIEISKPIGGFFQVIGCGQVYQPFWRFKPKCFPVHVWTYKTHVGPTLYRINQLIIDYQEGTFRRSIEDGFVERTAVNISPDTEYTFPRHTQRGQVLEEAQELIIS